MAKKKVTIVLYPTNDANAITFLDCTIGSSLTPELEFTGRRSGNDIFDRIVTTLPYMIESEPETE